jgi:hypothetical protein
MTDYKELYESATNEIATLKDEAKALDRKLTNLVLDLGWDCQRMSCSGIETYNAICKVLNIEEYKEDYVDETQTYDPPMTDTEQYLLDKEREEEHKSYDY